MQFSGACGCRAVETANTQLNGRRGSRWVFAAEGAANAHVSRTFEDGRVFAAEGAANTQNVRVSPSRWEFADAHGRPPRPGQAKTHLPKQERVAGTLLAGSRLPAR
jgi:hypothetical protein